MKQSPLLKLQDFGQSIWMDYIRRKMILTGELKQLIEEDGIRGVTSNPSIFEKVIAGSHDYDSAVSAMALEGKSIEEIYQTLTVEDVQMATDEFRPLYDSSDGKHGFVSLEVNPHLAHDAEGTIKEARGLWHALNRPNAFIKVPATKEGLIAIQQLISEGVNVNVTLLFGLPRYRKVAEAYIAGLEARVEKGLPVAKVASVASFFLSRIDVLVDPMLEELVKNKGPKAETASELHGQVAIASAKQAYQIYKEMFSTERFKKLVDKGARTQRVLWASTSTKNPDYSDVKYVEALIGPETINTLPQETLNAYRDHGDPAARLEEGLAKADRVLDQLPELDIDIDAITQQLEDEGVEKFNKPYDSLMETLKEERSKALEETADPLTFSLDGYEKAVEQHVKKLEEQNFSARLWRKDGSLWSQNSEEQKAIRNALGWLHVAEKMEQKIADLIAYANEVREAGFSHVLHMGMGGSSLAPLVFQRSFKTGDQGIPLTVLDSTDPTTIKGLEQRLPLQDTLFIVASKSGTTTEPRDFCDYFYSKLKDIKGDRAGENFVVVTDPGTPLVRLAEERNFRRSFINFKDIGGRYSALSYFGLLPAALMGLDVGEMLVRALRMAHACGSCIPAGENSAVRLGAVLGQLAREGRDKVTFLVPDAISTFGMWLEQLLAESTGKEGTGLLPIALEPAGDPSVYGKDRLFIHVKLSEEKDESLDTKVVALKKTGQPVVSIEMKDRLDLAQEFVRWEIATATAGAILGINAFNQPNVQESKDNTKRLLDVVSEKGELPGEQPTIQQGLLSFYGKEGTDDISDALALFLRQSKPGDYLALLAYLTEEENTEKKLQEMRLALRDTLQIATTLGYGPRYLHSTGQLHKGGPNTGLFIQLTADEADGLNVPGKTYDFGILQKAQAQGDFEALRKHGRRVIRLDLGSDVARGLEELPRLVEKALERIK